MKNILFLLCVAALLAKATIAQGQEATPVPTPRLGSLSTIEQARVRTEEKRSDLEARFEKKEISKRDYDKGMHEYHAEIKEHREEAAKVGDKKSS